MIDFSAKKLRGLIEPRWDEERVRAGLARPPATPAPPQNVRRVAGMGLLFAVLLCCWQAGSASSPIRRWCASPTARRRSSSTTAEPGCKRGRRRPGVDGWRGSTPGARASTSCATRRAAFAWRRARSRWRCWARDLPSRGWARRRAWRWSAVTCAWRSPVARRICSRGRVVGLFPPAETGFGWRAVARRRSRARRRPSHRRAGAAHPGGRRLRGRDPRAPLAAFTLGRLYSDELAPPGRGRRRICPRACAGATVARWPKMRANAKRQAPKRSKK